MSRRLIRTVKLNFFEDEQMGEFGLAPYNTINCTTPFNAFWSGQTIFHDVFEHAHEETQYFLGKNAFNVGGEMAAMGAMWYYIDVLGIGNSRKLSRMPIDGESMRLTTQTLIEDTILKGIPEYGDTLESGVPLQSPVDNTELEAQIRLLVKEVKAMEFDPTNDWTDANDSDTYKESVTFRKVADLHRYGYRMAEKLVPDSNFNHRSLVNFIEVLNTFTSRNRAEELRNLFTGMEVRLYKGEGNVTWTCKLIADPYAGARDMIIRTGKEDLYNYFKPGY